MYTHTHIYIHVYTYNKYELTEETKDLIRKRASIKNRSQRNQNIEYIEMCKFIKR